MKLKHVTTRNGNFFVFEVDLGTGLPVKGKPGFYSTPEGSLIEKKESAISELGRIKKKWGDQYKEKEIPHEIYRPFAELFTDTPSQRSFGPKKEEVDPGPFAVLAALKEKMGK